MKADVKSVLQFSQCDKDVFWSRVNKDGSIPEHNPNIGNCWEWSHGTFDNGYGRFSCNGKSRGTHRISYILCVGDPFGKCVLHKCDNRKCVRPSHLFLGTKTDNVYDMCSKGRQRNGATAQRDRERLGIVKKPKVYLKKEEHPMAKLNSECIMDMIRLRKSGLSYSKIADIKNINPTTAHRAITGISWKEVTATDAQRDSHQDSVNPNQTHENNPNTRRS